MSIIIKLQGLPLDATSVDVRRYFLGLTIPDGGVHILGGEEGTVFIEFASDEDARQAMSRGDGKINNSNIKLLLSSRTEMVSLLDVARQLHQNYLQQSQSQPQPQTQPSPQAPSQPQPQPQSFNNPYQHQNPQHQNSLHQPNNNNILVDPRLLSQNYLGIMSGQATQSAQPQQLLLPQQSQIFNQYHTPTTTSASLLGNMPMLGGVDMGSLGAVGGLNSLLAGQVSGLGLLQQDGGVANLLGPNGHNNSNNIDQQNNSLNNDNRNSSLDNRGRGVSSMRGGDDKLFANKRCVLAASNIPYRASSKDIIEFLSEFHLKEENIRRRYNAKGQPTADAKIAFPTPEAATKALKIMNKKTLCGRPVFFKPV